MTMSPMSSQEQVLARIVPTQPADPGKLRGRAAVGEDGAFWSMGVTQHGEGAAGQTGSCQEGWGGVPSSSGPQGEGQAVRPRQVGSGVQGKGHGRERT